MFLFLRSLTLRSRLSREADSRSEVLPGFAFDNAGDDIGCIVPTVRVEGASVGGQMGVEFGPSQLPTSWETKQVQRGGGVGEDARLLVARLVEPLDPCCGG